MRIGLIPVLMLFLAACALRGEVLDRVVASVNSKPILLSDLDEQASVSALLEGKQRSEVSAADREAALNQLIDRLLIAEQIAHGEFSASDADVEARVQEMRKQLGAVSDAAWQATLRQYGLDDAAVRRYARAEIEQLQFVEARFRPSVQVSDQQVEDFYRSEFLPALRRRGAREVPLADVRARVSQIVEERQITALMSSWLQSLRLQASVEVLMRFSAVPGTQ